MKFKCKCKKKNYSEKFDLEDRLVKFVKNAALFCKNLPNDVQDHYANQLLRSGGSAALNFGEAQGTNTDKYNVYKASISLKELKETQVNLKIRLKWSYGNKSKIISLLDEAEQLMKTIATTIKNKK